MDFDEYQQRAIGTDMFDKGERDIESKAFFSKLLGLVGETGEIAEKFKKIYRDNDGKITDDQIKDMQKELGDVLWYTATIADYLGIKFSDVAGTNITKLESRKKRGVQGGSGDNR